MSEFSRGIKGPVYIILQTNGGQQTIREFYHYYEAKKALRSKDAFFCEGIGWAYPASHICFSREEAERVLKPK